MLDPGVYEGRLVDYEDGKPVYAVFCKPGVRGTDEAPIPPGIYMGRLVDYEDGEPVYAVTCCLPDKPFGTIGRLIDYEDGKPVYMYQIDCCIGGGSSSGGSIQEGMRTYCCVCPDTDYTPSGVLADDIDDTQGTIELDDVSSFMDSTLALPFPVIIDSEALTVYNVIGNTFYVFRGGPPASHLAGAAVTATGTALIGLNYPDTLNYVIYQYIFDIGLGGYVHGPMYGRTGTLVNADGCAVGARGWQATGITYTGSGGDCGTFLLLHECAINNMVPGHILLLSDDSGPCGPYGFQGDSVLNGFICDPLSCYGEWSGGAPIGPGPFVGTESVVMQIQVYE